MILAGPHAEAGLVARFRAEAEAVARLQHPNIVQIHEVGEHTGCPYFSLEFVDGGNLARKCAGRPLAARAAAELLVTLARAMHYCHQRGIIHRDLKPANVLLTADGQPKITDFGLAKQVEGDGAQTRSGAFLGTPSYMAPEQAAGKIKDISPRTDVYALGAMLYELLTGRPPFRGATPMEIACQVMHDEPTPPGRSQPKLPRDLDTICLKALAKAPARRYQSALALAQDLERFLAGEPILGRRETLAGKLWRKARRHPVTVLSLLAVVLVLVSAAGVVHWADAARRKASLEQQAIQQALEVAKNKEAFEKALAAEEWTAAHLDTLDGVVADLERLAPDQADEARQRLRQHLGDAVRDSFSVQKKPVLGPDDVRQIDAVINQLAVRDPDQAQQLRKEFAERCGRLELVIDLKNSLDDLGAVFAGAPFQVGRDGKTLARQVAGTAGSRVRTVVPCIGNVELEAAFSSWKSAAPFGLVLNETAQTSSGYAFLLAATPGIAPSVMAGAPPVGRTLSMEIHRGGVRLRQQPIQVQDGPLVLRATRQKDRLIFQVRSANTQSSLEFQELFPFSGAADGFFGVQCPAGVGLEGLRAWRQALPATPSPVERGDSLYGAGQFEGALDEYRIAANTLRTTELRQEALCKEAICLTALRREKDAVPLFEQVSAEQGPRWPVVAGFQLWPILVRQQRLADADAVFHRVSSHYQAGQAAALLPDSIRKDIREAYRRLLRGYYDNFYYQIRFDPERARNLNRAVQVETYLQGSGGSSPELKALKVIQVLHYHQTDQAERALRAAEELLRDPAGCTYEQIWIVLDIYAWLMQRNRTPQRGLDEVDRWLRAPGGYRPVGLQLLVNRARLHAALNQWDQAERDLDDLLRLSAPDYYPRLDAYVLLGFLRERRSDGPGAQAAWRQGWALARKIKGATVSFEGSMLGALSNEITDADAEVMIAEAMGVLAGDSPIASVIKNDLLPVPFVAAVVRERWRSPRGREHARKAAFRDLSCAELYRGVFILSVAEGFHQGAVQGDLSPDQETLLWELAQNLILSYSERHSFTEAQAFQGILAWSGTTNLLGWSGLAAGLTPSVRGPLAYVMGHRYLRLKRSADAANLFRTALRDSTADSALRRLTQAELDRLKAK
jgi:hypothetical protein